MLPIVIYMRVTPCPAAPPTTRRRQPPLQGRVCGVQAAARALPAVCELRGERAREGAQVGLPVPAGGGGGGGQALMGLRRVV